MIRLSLLPLAVCFLLGCHPSYTIVEHSDIALPSGEQPKLVVEMINGPITITTAKCKEITGQLTKRAVGADQEDAEKELKNITFDSNVVDGKIIIKARRTDGGKSWNSSGAEATLQIPLGSQVELITSNGTIQVTGKNQGVIARSSNGAITLNGGAAPVEVKTSNGAVRCTDVVGAAKIETSNGLINVKGKGLLLDCKSANGSIDFAGNLAEGNHKLITSNSHVNVILPEDINLNLDAGTSNGSIKSQFNISNKEGNKKNTVLKGAIGNGDTAKTLLLKTSNSSISIKKGKDKAAASDKDAE
ncbi:MAG TPA: DUF4097 family beta strand repeat-containing protein [Gemmatales bacterium]|nr:DUF4097 family beta strand repeat-containing protein [Gemmatales bacterium]